ncbi:hypothetical protein SLA2020_351900 [Shorea laevis]
MSHRGAEAGDRQLESRGRQVDGGQHGEDGETLQGEGKGTRNKGRQGGGEKILLLLPLQVLSFLTLVVISMQWWVHLTIVWRSDINVKCA